MPLVDSFGRTIDYLRVSVTDRCNFRCVYCMPEEGAPTSPRACILSFEEIERLVRIAAGLGVSKVRLTGGEPLVRRDIDRLVERVAAVPGIRELTLTTNGFLLGRYARTFAAAGLRRVNISLDTLREDRFTRIARRGNLDAVWSGIEAALQAGLSPVKINCVAMRGWNDDEMVDFARLTRREHLHVRFIELMPINWSQGEESGGDALMPGFARPEPLVAAAGPRSIALYAQPSRSSLQSTFHWDEVDPHGLLDGDALRRAFISAGEIRQRIEAELGPLAPWNLVTNGPATTFKLKDAQGSIGFISQISQDRCVHCNRLRLTADGQLRPCLMADGEVDLRAPLREGASDLDIANLFRLVVRHKPKEHRLEDGLAPVGRTMSQIGG